MDKRRTYLALLALAVATALFVSACGGSGDSGAAAPDTPAATVSVSSVDGVGDVLVDAQGAALYAADQERSGMVVCTGSCTSIWKPLTVSGRPTAGDGVVAKLGTVERPDGHRQVTLAGRLLYRFMEDPRAGTVTGNGFADSFDGQAFRWHVATPQGISTSDDNSSSSSGSPGYYG
jgi:predicted lipoprotein with Yx(FWY)xxD motif